MALSLTQLDVVVNDQDDGARSVGCFPASKANIALEACGELGSLDERGILAEALTTLGDRARRDGSTVMAAFHYADALVLHYELGAQLGIAQCLERVAQLAASRGKPMHAAWFLDSAAT